MASVQKRGDRSWLLVVEAGTKADGSRGKKTKTVRVDDDTILKSPKKLREFLNDQLTMFKIEVETGLYISPDKMTFASFVEKWKAKFVLKDLAYKTTENYLLQADKRIVPYFGRMPMDKIKTMHIIDYLDKLANEGLGSATRVYNYRVLRSIFQKAAQWKVIDKNHNPMDGVDKPKETPTVKLDVYDETETSLLFAKLQDEDTQFRILITLALTTGMRRGELLGLEWNNVDIDNGIITITQTIPAFKKGQPVIKMPKTKSSIREVAIPTTAISELKNYRKEWIEFRMSVLNMWKAKDREFLFCNMNYKDSFGLPLYPKTLGDRWRDFHKKLNSEIKYIRFHDLRHTSATLLINQGVHAKIISERLGHSNIGTTMNVYGHVIRKADQAAANLFDQFIAK